jgi:hypothetical protein
MHKLLLGFTYIAKYIGPRVSNFNFFWKLVYFVELEKV